MAALLLHESSLYAFLSKGQFAERYVPVRGASGAHFTRLKEKTGDGIDLRSPRAPMSVKPFCFPPEELVARYPEQEAAGVAGASQAQRLVAGVRACELRALVYLDRVFGNPPVSDPFYQTHRAGQTLVSVDCVTPHDTCFCNLVGGSPYPTEGFDVNLTPVEGSYLVEAHSKAGQALVDEARELLEAASPADLAARDRARQSAVEQLEEANAGYVPTRPPDEALAEAEDAAVWDGLALGCVECGACTHICPTCHCFSLFEQDRDGKGFERLRAWDSCVYSGYSRMAGASQMKPNPRSRFRSRFANRFLHKYLWSPKLWNMLGCVGCGRCVECCPGKIDIRRVIRDLRVPSSSLLCTFRFRNLHGQP